jgi:hypothetical protein
MPVLSAFGPAFQIPRLNIAVIYSAGPISTQLFLTAVRAHTRKRESLRIKD